MPGAWNGRVPDDVPTVPRLDLDYDDIERGELIGQGGNADVYRGRVVLEDWDLDIAVKQPRFQETLHRDSVSRFVEEAETWARLDDYEGVVGVVDHGTEPLPWLALEYMDAGTLTDVLETDPPLEQRLWVATEIARAVRYAHRHGVAHLDLKPSNVLFRHIETRWAVPKVSDWGLARMLLEDTGSIEGLSPRYAAPEQFDPDTHGSPDDYTDTYQVGVLAYELATGRLPFEGPAPTVMQSVLHDDPPAPSEVADVPEAVDDAVLPAIATKKDDRYEATIDLRRALESLYESLPDVDSAVSAGAAARATANSGVEDADTGSRPDDTEDEPKATTDTSTTPASGAKTDISESSEGTSEAPDDVVTSSSAPAPSTGSGGGRSASTGRATGADETESSRRSLLKFGGGIAAVGGVAGVGALLTSDGGETNDGDNKVVGSGGSDDTETSDSSGGSDAEKNDSSGGSSEGGIDVINVIGYPEGGNTLFRDYYSLSDGSEDIIVPDGLRDGAMQEQVGNPMDNVIGTAPATDGPALEAFVSLYQDTYDDDPGVFTAHSYDSAAVGILANVAAGENSGLSVRDQMRNIANPNGLEVTPESFIQGVEEVANGNPVNYQGASSDVNFNESGDPANAAYSIWGFDGEGGTTTEETLNFEGYSPEGVGPSADSISGGFGREVKLGILLPKTGNLASVGQEMINAAEIPVMQVNSSPLLLTVDAQIEDTNTDPNTGIQGANSLVNAGVPFVCGPASSGVNVPVSQEAFIPNEVVGCSPSSTALSVTNLEDDDYIFRTAPSDILQGRVMAQVVSERLGGETAATLYVNNDYGQQLSERFSSVFEDEFGGTVTGQFPYNRNEDSYTSVIQEALEES